jgi:hypothetical protein
MSMRPRGPVLLLAAATALAAVAACVRPSAPKAALPALPAPQLLDTLSVLATGSMPSAAEKDARDRRFASRELTLPAYVDQLLVDPRFGRVVVPRLLYKLASGIYSLDGFSRIMVLEHGPDASGVETWDSPDHGPCKPEETVEVHPWWAPKDSIRVCKDAYRPEVWRDTRLPSVEKPVTRCDAAGAVVRPPPFECGAGPNLQRAARDPQHFDELRTSLRDEVFRTTAWVVDQDLPISTIFTTNSTWRDRNAEYTYRLWDAEAHERPVDTTGLDAWPADGKLAPRPEATPGMHAGVLTAPHLVYFFANRRQRMKMLYQILWCTGPGSSGAKAEDLLALGSGNLQVTDDGWKVLAAKPICTECHAKLDYGARFFWGYEDANATANHYLPESQLKGTGPLYGNDIDDPRGEAPLTPSGFVSLALAQPEFRGCMVDDVVSHVFGDRATPGDQKAVSDAYARKPTFREISRAALLRFAAEWSEHDIAPAPAELVDAAPSASGDQVAIGDSLRQQIDQKCEGCHDGQTKDAPDLRPKVLPRSLVVSMLDQVAFGRMPKKKEPLPEASRRALVQLLVGELWSDPDQRATALAHFGGADERTLSAYGIDTALDVIGGLAADPAPKPGDWRIVERGLTESFQKYDPSYVAITSLAALDACKRAGKTGDALDECLLKATDPMALSRYPLPAPTATPSR